MAATFSELVTRTRDWLNRDPEVITDAILQDAIRWAADDAYRTLRIPPLECTRLYCGLGSGALNLLLEPTIGSTTVTSFAVPTDLIEVIKIRTTDASGKTIRLIDSKADVRTFFDPHAEVYNQNAVWTRKGGRIYVSAQVGSVQGGYSNFEEYVELYYYRRLPALDALYTVVAENFDSAASFLSLAPTQAGDALEGEGFLLIRDDNLDPIVENPPTAETVFSPLNNASYTDATAVDPALGIIKFAGKTPEHWLLNENEKLLIYGGLAEAFSYLQEDDQAEKYKQRFLEEISELNDEDVRRNSAGGTIQMNFNGRGLI